MVGAEATRIAADGVTLADGRVLSARLVVDARGPDVSTARGRAGFQKFIGHELELASLTT